MLHLWPNVIESSFRWSKRNLENLESVWKSERTVTRKLRRRKLRFSLLRSPLKIISCPLRNQIHFGIEIRQIISKIQGYGNLRLYVSLSFFEESADEMEVTFPFNRANRNRELSRENEIETEIIQDDGNHDASFCCSRVCKCETIVIGRRRKPDWLLKSHKPHTLLL